MAVDSNPSSKAPPAFIPGAASRLTPSSSKYAHAPGNNGTGEQTGLMQDLHALGLHDLGTIKLFMDTALSGEANDSDFLLERLIDMLSRLPDHSHEGKQMADHLIDTLWSGLQHPPVSSLGDQYRYREPDGSNNALRDPTLGAANTPYARTVPASVYQSPDLPDADVIFDLLMARDEENFEEHPNGVSSMMFYLAAIITHDLFQTDHRNFGNNLTSSYLDLSPLYGRNSEEQKLMREFKDGMLKPDCFSSKRLIGLPPGCGVFLIMFNRFHNHVVKQLAVINEGRRFTKPGPDASDVQWEKYDNDLFQTGRLITCGLYINIILKDYVRTILSLNRSGSMWSLDPRSKMRKNLFTKPTAEAVGNQVSVEFNLIYRWHSAISKRDEAWTENEMRRVMQGKDPRTASMRDVLGSLHTYESRLASEPEARPFASLSRGADGRFDDDALVAILQGSIEDVAGSFGANKVPHCMRTLEILGMQQARVWNVATLNEFRAHFGLTRHKTFEDINPDPEVARKLMQLYDSPDAVELYPGVVAEKAKPVMTPGSGICVNFTTSRAILSDAVTLVRGDRFYTVDYTPKNLTNWGFAEADYDLGVDQGHVMYKLILRAFPHHFRRDSVYAHFPFVTPQHNYAILENLNNAEQYSWAKPARLPETVVIRSYRSVQEVLSSGADFRVDSIVEAPQIEKAQKPRSIGSGSDSEKTVVGLEKAQMPLSKDAYSKVASFYTEAAQALMAKNKLNIGPGVQEVDVIRDIIGLAQTRFVSSMLNIPLRTETDAKVAENAYTEQELCALLMASFAAIYGDNGDVVEKIKNEIVAKEVAGQLTDAMKSSDHPSQSGMLSWLWSWGSDSQKNSDLSAFGSQMIRTLMHSHGKSLEAVVADDIVPLAAATVTQQTAMLAAAVDFYLGDDGIQHLPELQRLARGAENGNPASDELLLRYILEASRLRAALPTYRFAASPQILTDYTPCVRGADGRQPVSAASADDSIHSVEVPTGARILLDLSAAGRDPAVFAEPHAVRLDRPLGAYLAAAPVLGGDAARAGLVALFKEVIGLKGLRRAPGARGAIKSLPPRDASVNGGEDDESGAWSGLRRFLTADQSAFWTVPTTMRVRWDA